MVVILVVVRYRDLWRIAGDVSHRASRDEHEITTRQCDLAGQARVLMPDGVLGVVTTSLVSSRASCNSSEIGRAHV